MPRATLTTKLVRKYSGVPGSDQSPHEMVVTVAESGQLGETAPVVDSGLVEGGVMEDDI